jgi:hypothetical protein
MKKGKLVMAIFVALSFLVSVIAAAPSFAARATQTAPKPQQQPSIPPIKDQIKAKDRFWDLAVDYCIINGELTDMSPCVAKHINVKVGHAVSFNCYYKVMTIPVHDITWADAAYWGPRNLAYKISGAMNSEPPVKVQQTRSLPHFTWEDVKKWQTTIKKPGRKAWVENLIFTWTPSQEDNGKKCLYLFLVDVDNDIHEADGPTENGFCMVEITVNP